MTDTTLIEINGIKMEVDLRSARRVDTLRVGDRVKVLVKTYTDYVVHAGTIVGFDAFEKLPTITIAYVQASYGSSPEIKFVAFNAQCKDVEIVKSIDNDTLDLDKNFILDAFANQIAAKREEIDTLERKREFFINAFGAYWQAVAPAAVG